MASNFSQFKKQIDSAVDLIEQNSLDGIDPKGMLQDSEVLPNRIDKLIDTNSLLDRCEFICQKHKPERPVIRTIHHLACSGGTLVSKCISAMSNVYLLSEIHPYTDLALGNYKPKYSPSDIVSLTKYASVPNQKDLATKLFKQGIDLVYDHIHSRGGLLILRDHTHSDFNVSDNIPPKSIVTDILSDTYDINSVLTVRNPIDSYASLVKNGWVHFSPGNFEEYCRRFLILVNQFSKDSIFLYEDFVKDPHEIMKCMTSKLRIPYDDSFDLLYPIFKVTGDSGRSSNVIAPRKRRALEDGYLKEINESESFAEISDRFGYK